MPIQTTLWTISSKPQPLAETRITDEKTLEDMIVSAPAILSNEWMLIGRQENTGFGGRIDLLAIAPDASLILIELKRARTPREVAAQAIDYASWVEQLGNDDISAIYRRFSSGGNLAEGFQKRFGAKLNDEDLNKSHQIVIVSASLDAGTERIVKYLNQREISINILCFQVFAHGDKQLLSRTWLLDPVETQTSAVETVVKGPKEPWNGEHYVSFGADASRSWDEAVKYGFISAGGGAWYSRTLQILQPGDRIWVRIPGVGYVGVGKVLETATPAADFKLSVNGEEKPALDVLARGGYNRQYAHDLERSEYFVRVQWLDTLPAAKAVHEIGFFGNQNTVCRPRTPDWRSTVERLKQLFQNYDANPELW